MYTKKCFLYLVTALTLNGCAYGPGVITVPQKDSATTGPDSLSFAIRLATHLALPDSTRFAAHTAAESLAADWHKFEDDTQEVLKREYDHLSYANDDPPRLQALSSGVDHSIIDLKLATDRDPSFAEGWAAMGSMSAQIGDLNSAQRYLDHALQAADSLTTQSDEIKLNIYRNYAWVMRDLARWQEGLDLVQEGLTIHPGDPDLVLVKGLLLAGAGRFNEALSVAVAMKPLSYPQYDYLYRGLKYQTSAYANNWIRAMALLAVGEVQLAYAKIGDLDLYAYRGLLPHGARFWKDAALLAELVGDPKAPLYYGVGFVTSPYKFSYPAMANNVTPQVMGIPSEKLPVYTSYGPRFFVGGSPFVYICYQINLMADSIFDRQRSAAAGRALQMLGILEKRNIRRDVCHALRGRIYFANEDFQLATTELTMAQTAFAAKGKVDAVTSLLLGLIQLQNQEYGLAQYSFLESTRADSTSALTWRSLGVAYARQKLQIPARQAMDRAVELDPWNVTGLYNRGLFRLQNGKLGLAAADLQHAMNIDPTNREVQNLRNMVLASARQAGADSATIESVTMGTPLGEAGNPAIQLARLQAEIDSLFTVPDSLRVSDAEAENRIDALMNRYMRDRDPMTRAVLALALIDHRQLAKAQRLLEPGWGVDLSPDEELMLLYCDHEIGEKERAAQVIQDVIASGGGHGNPYSLALAAQKIRTSTDPVGTDMVSPDTHGFFGWWRDSKRSYGSGSGRTKYLYDFNLFRIYRNDPLFEQAVWGMGPTPITGTNMGAGLVSPGKQ